jgi:LacI family transcriptional regulator
MRRHDWRVDFLASRNVPFVALGSSLNAVDYPYIEVDARAGFRSLVAHLADQGHRRIAYIGASPELMLQSVRLAGYREGIAALGLDEDEALIAEGDLTRQGGYLAAQQLLSAARPPTAIIGANDLTAIGAMRAARERGLRIGYDLAVAGYDGVGEAEHTHPPLTTLNQPVYDISRRLVTMLLMLITNLTLPEHHVLLQPELLVRASTTG